MYYNMWLRQTVMRWLAKIYWEYRYAREVRSYKRRARQAVRQAIAEGRGHKLFERTVKSVVGDGPSRKYRIISIGGIKCLGSTNKSGNRHIHLEKIDTK